MANKSAALAAPLAIDDLVETLETAEILELDGVAERRERFLAHAAAAGQVVAYEFAIPSGALVQALGRSLEARDAQAQLQLVVALTGGSVGKFPGGLVARIPATATDRFEAAAKPLIEAFLIGWRA
ncbi:hypothetical protein BH10PSE3_BH10PSE3_26820 [soil metagenome]